MASVRRNSPGQLSKGQRVIRLVDCSTGEPFEGERIGLEIEGGGRGVKAFDYRWNSIFGEMDWFENLWNDRGSIMFDNVCDNVCKAWKLGIEFLNFIRDSNGRVMHCVYSRKWNVFLGENEMYWNLVLKKFESDSYHIFFKYPTSRGRIEQRQSEHSLSGFRYFEYTENLW